MILLEATQIDSISGGGPLTGLSIGLRTLGYLYAGINAGGATLRNYYGDAMTLEIFAAGNMCA